MDVAMAVAALAVELGAHCVLMENVPRFGRSVQWACAARLLQRNGFGTDMAEVDSARLGLPQRRRRVITFSVQGGVACSVAVRAGECDACCVA